MFHVPGAEGHGGWLGVRIPVTSLDAKERERGTLLLPAGGLLGGTLAINPWPWFWLALAVAGIAVACWAPFLRGLTRSLRRLEEATGEMAEGRFDVDIRVVRSDEVWELSRSIARMADRLSPLVQGQKRFLGDAAHELCAPLARLQAGLAVLEQRVGEEAMQDVREDLDEMARLVEEVLQFSKATMQGPGREPERFSVAEMARGVCEREGPDVEMRIAPELELVSRRALVERALGNLVRNAVRYVGDDGPITVAAEKTGKWVTLTVTDHGPGLPEEELERVFAPFYRLETSRNRASGGFGLGLSIVKGCVEACGGTVACRNRKPRGLEVAIRLPG